MGTVNIDYIGTITVKDARVQVNKEEIPGYRNLLNDLHTIYENTSETTIPDLQSRMDAEFPDSASSRQEFGFIEPYRYSASYVDNASYPNARKYIKDIESRTEEYLNCANKKYENLRDSPDEFQSEVSEYVNEHKKNLIKEKTKDFFDDCIRFIHAYSYYSYRSVLLSRPDVKMCTSAYIGWSSPTYQITEDVSVTVWSNFGFGMSAKFYMILNYKGIKIVPFSMLVTYFFANQADIVQYYRNYPTCKESWDQVLMDVRDTASMTLDNPEEFVKIFIMEDISKMLDGLRKIITSPEEYMLKFCEKQGEDSPYLTVRNMTKYEHNQYAIYPKEMTMVMQASKISGALDFLKELASLTPIYGKAQDAIQEIKEMALNLLPKIESNIETVSKDIERLERIVNVLDHNLEGINQQIRVHDKTIAELGDKKESEMKDEGKSTIWSHSIARQEYEAEHPEYTELLQKCSELNSERNRHNNDISRRDSFRSNLNLCLEKICTSNISDTIGDVS